MSISSFLFFSLILLATFFPTNAASVASGMGANDLIKGAMKFSVNNVHDILRRQNTTICATIAPLCPGTGACCSGICCANACCVGGTICSGGQCVANNPTPNPNTVTTPAAQTSMVQTGNGDPMTTGTAVATTTGTAGNSTGNGGGGNGNGGNGTDTSTQTLFMEYNVTTVSNDNGPQFITFGSFTESSDLPATQTSQTTPSETPLVVQQVPPTVTNNPDVQMQYQPTDAWETSGSQAGTDQGSTPDNTTSLPNHPISLCNNGTKVSNTVGSTIQLQFIGVEASLLMIPSIRGAKYEVKFDDEAPEILDSYKEDGTTCQVDTPWVRTGLDNKPHNVTITIKGDGAGAAGSSGQLEFNGLIFKGPQTEADSNKSNKWLIVGVSVGGLLILVVLGVLIIMCIRRRRARPTISYPITQETSTSPPPLTHSRQQSTQPMAPQLYTPSHRRGDSTFSSKPSLPGSPQMSYRTSFAQGHVQGQSHSVTGSPAMHGRTMSWNEGGLPMGAAYAPYSATQPVGGGSSAPYSIPVTTAMYGVNGNGNGTPPRPSFGQGHARTGSNLSINRNPFE